MNEEEKKVIEYSKNCLMKITLGMDSEFDVNILDTLLNIIEKLQKENEKLREYYEEQNEVNAKFIPVQKVKDKEEELNKLLADIDYKDVEDKQEREFYKKEYYQVVAQIIVLKGLLEESEEKK